LLGTRSASVGIDADEEWISPVGKVSSVPPKMDGRRGLWLNKRSCLYGLIGRGSGRSWPPVTTLGTADVRATASRGGTMDSRDCHRCSGVREGWSKTSCERLSRQNGKRNRGCGTHKGFDPSTARPGAHAFPYTHARDKWKKCVRRCWAEGRRLGGRGFETNTLSIATWADAPNPRAPADRFLLYRIPTPELGITRPAVEKVHRAPTLPHTPA